MRTTTHIAIVAIAGLFATQRVHPQGAFVNLDFEQAIAPLDGHQAPIARALPGWTGYVGGGLASMVWYDDRPIDAAGISLVDRLAPQQPLQPLEGDYSAWLMGSTSLWPQQQAAAIAQIGQIPADSKSIRFLFSTAYLPEVTFAGQSIPLVELDANTSYITLGGDVSLFAGDTGELRFTVLPGHGGGLFDNIQFSPVAIPEPTTLVLSLLGVLIVGWRAKGSVFRAG
jgi:hypothetical protein